MVDHYAKTISPEDLVPLNLFTKDYPVTIDIVYAKKDHKDNYFEQLYHRDSCIMWAHKDIAVITLLAAKIVHKLYGWTIKIDDSLRTVQAQQKMTAYSANIDASLLSKPGQGAHPRAMAIDIEPIDQSGTPVNMGTAFDHFTADVKKDGNPAERSFTNFKLPLQQCEQIWTNRARLEFAMRQAAALSELTILPLPQEWWDFRFPTDIWQEYAPLNEDDLPAYQRLLEPDIDICRQILNGERTELTASGITYIKDKLSKITI